MVTHGDVQYWCLMMVNDRLNNAGIEVSDRLWVHIIYGMPVWFAVLCTQMPNCETFIRYWLGISRDLTIHCLY